MPSMNMSAFCKSVTSPFSTSKGMYLQIAQLLQIVGHNFYHNNRGWHHSNANDLAAEQSFTQVLLIPCITFFEAAMFVAAARNCKPQVSQLVGCFIQNIYIIWLDIHVSHVSGMHVLQSQSNLQVGKQSFAHDSHKQDYVVVTTQIIYLSSNTNMLMMVGLHRQVPDCTQC